ncbi:glycosyltransferase [Piscinibacter sakaiensis]|uniref:glycosyltransferase n=1 Tax=Piscinibacter sakaiensis TaxID=1547922 RepID=UPI003728E812
MPDAPPPDPVPPGDLAEADAWLRRLTAPELEALQDFCDLLLFSLPELGASRQAYVEQLADPAAGTLAKVWAGLLNGLARRAGRPLVSVLTSVYRGGAYIEAFLDNLTGQLGFGEDIELIVVDAASPEGEAEAVARRARAHPSIRLLRCERPLGIYAAWNLALAEARGDYLTNANVDDLRREDSIAVQAAALDRWPEVDVVYQDFFYTMDPRLPYAEVAALGWRSALPDALNPEVQMGSNPPHHAPMWRARLHRDLGPFDAGFQSAGDYEFWLRCLAAGRRFRKIADPHAVYFQNPAGLSTRPGSRGHAETRRALRRHGRRLLALHETLALARFP